MSVSEIALGFVPITFTAVGLTFLVSQIYYSLYAKEYKAKVVAIEKYLSRTGTRGQSKQIMYRELIEFYHNGMRYIFASAGKNFISKEIGSTAPVLILNNNPSFVRLKRSYHYMFGFVFTVAGVLAGYFISYRKFDHINFLYSIIIAIVAVILFYKFLKVKSKGQLKLSTLFETKFIKEGDLKDRDVFWKTQDLIKEKSKNARVGLIITLVFGALYLLLFNGCYQKLKTEEIELIKTTLTKFEGFEVLLNHSNNGPIIGFLACLVIGPLLIHSILYSLKRL